MDRDFAVARIRVRIGPAWINACERLASVINISHSEGKIRAAQQSCEHKFTFSSIQLDGARREPLLFTVQFISRRNREIVGDQMRDGNAGQYRATYGGTPCSA
jgi:hypothetical protein